MIKRPQIQLFIVTLALAMVLASSVAADTSLKFESAAIYGDKNDQTSNALESYDGRLYIAGVEKEAQSKSLVASYALPPAAIPISSLRWPTQAKSGLSDSNTFTDMNVSSDGLYFVGHSWSDKQSFAILAKFSANQISEGGTELWTAKPVFFPNIKNRNESFEAVAVVTEGGSNFIYVTGRAESRDANSTAVLAKYDINGQMIWLRELSKSEERNRGKGTALTALNGFLYVAGYTGSAGKGVKFHDIPLQATLWKYDFAGNQIWMKNEASNLYFVKGEDFDPKVEIAAFETHLYLVAGQKGAKDRGEVLISKYDEKGNLIGSISHNSETGAGVIGDARPRGIAVGTDRLFVAGWVEYPGAKKDSPKNQDAFLLEVDKGAGAVLAVHTYGEADRQEMALGVHISGTDVFMTGQKTSSSKKKADHDLMLLRYSTFSSADVAIDIMPKDAENNISTLSKDKIAVAILSSDKLNAPLAVKPNSLTFGRTGHEMSWESCGMQDANNDGKIDLLCFFHTEFPFWKTTRALFQKEDKETILKGNLMAGSRIKGKDIVQIDKPAAVAATPSASEPAPSPKPTTLDTKPIPATTTTEPTPNTTTTTMPSTSTAPASASTTTASTSPAATTTSTPATTAASQTATPSYPVYMQHLMATSTTQGTVSPTQTGRPSIPSAPGIKPTNLPLSRQAQAAARYRLLMSAGKTETVGKASSQAGAPSPKSGLGFGQAQIDSANEAFKQGNFSKAVDYYKEALQFNPHSAETHNNLALALVEQGNLKEAQAHLSEALKLNPDDASIRKNLDTVLAELAKLQGATVPAGTPTK